MCTNIVYFRISGAADPLAKVSPIPSVLVKDFLIIYAKDSN